jgi:hypothetical protein
MGLRSTSIRIGLVGSLLATFLASPNPAHAATGTCTINTDDPFKTVNQIGGKGEQICSGLIEEQQISVVLQQYRGLGLWADKARKTTPWASVYDQAATVYWNCTGSGNQRYRIVTDGQFIDFKGDHAAASVYSGNQSIRFTC